MQKPKHLRFAGILMIVSWILLSAFVFQWLLTYYRAERETLRRELDRQFAEARSQVMDSTLMNNLVDPLLCNQSALKVMKVADSSIAVRDTTRKHAMAFQMPGKTAANKMICTVTITDTSAGALILSQKKGSFIRNSGDIALHSIRLIVASSLDSGGYHTGIRQILPVEIDTGLLRKFFTAKMQKHDMNFPFHWLMKSSARPSVSEGSLTVSGKVFDGSVVASIDQFSWYLARQLFPQLLFSLVLLILTGTAFIFTFRSLKKQMLLNSLRHDFIGNITHELKTPVATIKVALESLRNFDMKKDPEVASDYLSMASSEMNRLDQLINKVLNISLLEENHHLMTLRVSSLKAMTERVIRSMTPRLVQEQAEVTLEAPDDDYLCPLDELFAEGVLINLIDNSLKYSGGKANIRVMLSQDGKQVWLTVRDHGPGIPEQFMHKVFDKFFRVPTGDRHNIKGHGLGLSYAAQVMGQHHGAIHVCNCDDGGCAFTLTFPKE